MRLDIRCFVADAMPAFKAFRFQLQVAPTAPDSVASTVSINRKLLRSWAPSTDKRLDDFLVMNLRIAGLFFPTEFINFQLT
jgi:hypothetical protein